MSLIGSRRWLALLLAWGSGAAFAATIHGQVTRVVDGDTLIVAGGRHHRITVRLIGIDAPEKDQPYGRQSKAHLASLVLGKAVDVEWDKRDAYGRTIGRVLLGPDRCPTCDKTRDAGLAQVSSGYAWWYRSESRELTHADKSRYALAENAARGRHGGLWADPSPVSPWDWRHTQAGHSSSLLATTGRQLRKAGHFLRHPVRSIRRSGHS